MAEWMDSLEAIKNLAERKQKAWPGYYGFYSSYLGGFSKDPWAMMVPLDDHMVHRGDGVFEAVRLYENAYFDLDSHLARLQRSADFLGMKLPFTSGEIKKICVDLAKLCVQANALLRIFVSRGPGSFGTNPYDCEKHHFYAVLTKVTPPSAAQYETGVRAFYSTISPKEAPYSGVKSCNYLQNVMMKKEAVDKGYDFALSVDSRGRICEGSTENFAIVTTDNELIAPKFDYTLRGTTLICVLELAEKLKANNTIKNVSQRDLSKNDLAAAKEMAFIGTTLAVLPVSELEGHKLKPGAVFQKLGQLLLAEMAGGTNRRTQIA
jgi:4-amino-4-deoxychorismate lyase